MESRQMGGLIIAGAAIQMLAFLYGMSRRSYLAVAIPVAVAMAGLAALAVWVGWTMMTVEAEMPEPELDEPVSE
jgi:hypothetical protein